MDTKSKTLISSFYDEEYLLPWWLEHHRKVFEHGILFNYFSTDSSVDIIHRICPTWEVRDTKNKDWKFEDNDAEYMGAEREVKGYKMVLTTTEFLVGVLPELPDEPTAYAIMFARLVDNEPDKVPTYGKPLVEQKHYGYIDLTDKHRFLHNYPDGQYYVGRHKTHLKTTQIPMLVFKYSFSPWTEELLKRKLQMKEYLNSGDIKRNLGLHHAWDRERIEAEYHNLLKRDDNRDFVLHR